MQTVRLLTPEQLANALEHITGRGGMDARSITRYALARHIDALQEQNNAMRHDLEATQGLWATDKLDSVDIFQINHASLKEGEVE